MPQSIPPFLVIYNSTTGCSTIEKLSDRRNGGLEFSAQIRMPLHLRGGAALSIATRQQLDPTNFEQKSLMQKY